ncbi:MAG: metalloregulator ArsR/SmtB family transcription factor [Gemmatimonadetes bacterium]|nr:metalloregulator ArsR/SmtB family transcription factor [Gemmatimonadota bacterium]MCC6774635.1 metalloregulator ArsR/SmtB family transcription factor [Gemmatimonadaceae bacterium]
MTPTVSLDRLSTLADSTRSRILLVLERHEMTVSELCAVLQLPQSTVSRHLKVLGDDGWLDARSEGTSRFYRIAAASDEWADRLWAVVRERVVALPLAAQDRMREEAVLAGRRSRSREFFATVAGEWEVVRSELYGSRLDLHIALALLDSRLVVGDLGCGTGQLSALLAPHVARVVSVDASSEMLLAARERVAACPNVALHLGDLEQLPLADGSLDLATLSLALHYVPDPSRAVAEAYRVLRPGGRLVVVDMMPHDRDDLPQRMGHAWRGFAQPKVTEWLAQAGFGDVRYTPLPPDESARGPALFAASGRT